MRTGVVGTVLAIALLLPGCSADRDSDYSGETVITLQSQVLEITAAAADGDPALAMVRLDELAAITNDALVRGEITEARRDSILSAILLVKADLERAIEAAEQAKRLAEEAAQTPDEASGETVVDREGRGEEHSELGSGEDTGDGANEPSAPDDGPGSSADGDSGGTDDDGGTDGDAGQPGGEGNGTGGEDDGKGKNGKNDKPRSENSAAGGNPGKGNNKGQDD